MRLLGLVSDSHDALPLVDQAVSFFRERGVDEVLHLGDITQPATVERFRGLPARFLRGNNDFDAALRDALAEGGFPPLEDAWTGVVEGVRVGATHGHLPRAMKGLAPHVQVLLHGHSHRRRAERVDGTLVVNPGALFRVHTKTIALLELPALRVSFYEVREDGVFPLP